MNESCHMHEHHFTCKLCHTLERVISRINEFFSYEHRFTCTGRQRCIGCLKLQISFRKKATNYRALLQKMTYKDQASCGSLPPCRSCHTYSMKKSRHTCKWAVSHLHVWNETCLVIAIHSLILAYSWSALKTYPWHSYRRCIQDIWGGYGQ